MAEHKRCMLAEAPCGYSPTLLEQMTRPKLERKGVVYSPSSLQGCHRQNSLKRGYDWYLNPDSAYQMLRGTIGHAGLAEEPAPEGSVGVIRELRLHAMVDTKFGPQQFSGQVDEILMNSVELDGTLHVSITDWKTKSEITHDLLEAEKRHVYQVNYYSWLVREALPWVLEDWVNRAPKEARMFLNATPMPDVSSVVVDDINIQYLSMSKARRFSSVWLQTARGRIKGDYGEDGRWHQFKPREYEELELQLIKHLDHDYTAQLIKVGIESQIEGEQQLAAPLVADQAQVMCRNCSVRETCVDIGLAQGYDMKAQEAFQRG